MFKPLVGARVVSDAGEPASPNAAAEHIIITIKGNEKPSLMHKGTNKTAKIGIVPKDEPIPIVIKSPIRSIANVARILECSTKGRMLFIKLSIPPVSFKTRA